MHELLERLGRGDVRLIEMCQQANHAWREFLTELNRRRCCHARGACFLSQRLSAFSEQTLANHDTVERLCGAL
jgi:hypothetical protein